MTIIPDTAIQQKQQQVAAQLVLLLSQKLPVCDWAISGVYGNAEGQADTGDAVRVWASVIADGMVTVTENGAYLETHGIGDNESVRVWAKRPVTASSVEGTSAEQVAADVSERAAQKVLTRAADILATHTPADASLFKAIRGAATLYVPFGPQAKVLANAAIVAFTTHLHYSEGDPVAYLDQWTTIRTVEEIAAELRAAGGGN